MFGFRYINGDPEKRSRFRQTVRVAWFSFVYAFALMGVGAFARTVYIILTR